MAESLGVEPSDRITTVYGLAIRCITVLPALDNLLSRYLAYYKNLVDRPGIEPGTEACKATVFPSIPTAHVWRTQWRTH